MKTISIKIEGVSPLLIHRFSESSEGEQNIKMKKSGKTDYGTPREQAEKCCYMDDITQALWVPSTWIKGAIQTVASDYKLKGSRKSLKSVSGGSILPSEEKIYFCEKYTLKDIEVDSRPVVIQRARVMRHRARLEKWSLDFFLELDESIIPTESLNELIIDSGKRSGIGDFRPQKGGPFGRYQLVGWVVL